MHRYRSAALALALLGLAVADVAAAADWRSRIAVLLSDRLRYESVAWFRPPAGGGGAVDGSENYGFAANQLRAGLRATLPNAQLLVELQDTRLIGLPTDATLSAPYGNLGPGAGYHFYARAEDEGETFLRQAVFTARGWGANAAIGRFEQADGLETLPGDADLLWIKRARVAERLLGPFGYTHVGRTVDGVKLWVDRPAWNATALAVRPTGGGFALEGGEQLGGVELLGASVTAKRPFDPAAVDARAFWFRYGDDRVEDGVPVRVDNRPLPARQADRDPVEVHTWGGHAATVLDAGAGRFDALAWGALQRGAWGVEPHRAWAGALEVGFQWPRLPLAPWMRAGINLGSGDDDPADGKHGTFVPLLPTPRVYALFPFYNAMNLEDRFVQVVAKPHPKIVLRADYHALRLNSSADLWYAGGGALQDDVFGYSGTTSAGGRVLAQVVDASVTVNPHRRVTLYGYLARAFGDDVVRATFAGSNATYGYLEATVRY